MFCRLVYFWHWISMLSEGQNDNTLSPSDVIFLEFCHNWSLYTPTVLPSFSREVVCLYLKSKLAAERYLWHSPHYPWELLGFRSLWLLLKKCESVTQSVSHGLTSLSMKLSRQESWSGWSFPSTGDLPDPGIERGSPALWANSLPSEPPGKPLLLYPKSIGIPPTPWQPGVPSA